jgi:nitrate/nitrite-specific signal transduction histidine kinase
VVAELVHETSGPPPPTTVSQQLLRITQELARRAVEERGAVAVYVTYRCRPDRVELSVSDDGEAPDGEAARRVDEVVHDRAEAIGAEIATSRREGLATVTVAVERTLV